MYKTKSVSDIVIYITLTIICLCSIFFIFRLLKYDDCKFLKESELTYSKKSVSDFYEVRGNVYIIFSDDLNIDYRLNLLAVNETEQFRQILKNGEEFEIGYSSNTASKEQREIIFLKRKNVVYADTETHKTPVIIHLIITFIGLSFFLICLIILLSNLVKSIR